MAKINFSALLFIFLYFISEYSAAITTQCQNVFLSGNPKSKLFNMERVLQTYKIFPKESEKRRLYDFGILEAKTDEAEFYEVYRNHPRYLEEYSSKFDRVSEARRGELITRFVPRYREISNLFLIRTHGNQKSKQTLEEIAKLNKIILDNAISRPNQLLSSLSRIQDLPKELVGSSDLRIAILIQLKLQNKELNHENVITQFNELKNLDNHSINWRNLDQLVLASEGKLTYKDAAQLYKTLRAKINDQYTDQMLQLTILRIIKRNFDTNPNEILKQSLDLAKSLTNMGIDKSKTINILKLLSFFPELTTNDIVESYTNIQNKIFSEKWYIHKDQSTEQAAYIYSILLLNERVAHESTNNPYLEQLIQWHYKNYFQIEAVGPTWLKVQYLENLLN